MLRSAIVLLCLLSCSNVIAESRQVFFSGIWWEVRSNDGYGPGNGHWCDDEQSVWVDDSGDLHLKNRFVNGKWCQVEVISHTFARYGTHRFQVISQLDQLDPDLVVAFFLYKAFQSPSWGCPFIAGEYVCEIDIEITDSFFEASPPPTSPPGPLIGTYTVQPATGLYDCSANPTQSSCAFHIYMPDGTYSSHEFSWFQNNIDFQSWHGHALSPSDNTRMAEWRYPSSAGFIPPEEVDARMHINQWICTAAWCSDGDQTLTTPQEVVIRNYFGSQVGIQYLLTVGASAGSGSGSITGPGINCGIDCSESFAAGENITLVANPDPGSEFVEWQGDSDCIDGQLQSFSNVHCIATFNLLPPIEDDEVFYNGFES